MVKIFLIVISLFGCITGFSQTFTGTTGNITDNQQYNYFYSTVTGISPSQLNAAHGLVTICLNISHTYDSDLEVHLISPDGTNINLFSGIGGGDDNFTNTCLNQSATQLINSGSAPFTGTFKPQETIGNMNNGQNGNGIWTLRIMDTYPQDAGILYSWSLTFGNNAPVPIVFTRSNLPIVIINTNGVEIPDEPKVNATMKIIYNGPGIMNFVTDTIFHYAGNIGIELRGATSQWYPQKPYKFVTTDTAGIDQNVSILSMPAEHEWCLLTNYNDKVFLRNMMAYRLFDKMGHYATRAKYCEVILNGSYQGIYLLAESIKRDNNRVNIAKLDSTESTGINVTGGYILKNDLWVGSGGWLLNYHPIDRTELDVHLLYEYPKAEDIIPQQETYIQTFINEMETALYSSNFTDSVNGYRKYISINSFIDYFIINELSRNNDGFKKSVYYHKDINTLTQISKLKAGPIWDFDWGWKNIWDCVIFQATDGSGWAHHINDCGPDANSNGWYIRMLQDTTFQNTLRCRWENFRSSFMSNDSIFNYIDSVATYLDTAQQRHYEKWGHLGVNTGTPEVEQDPPTFSAHITQFKNWIATRASWLDANIPGNANNCNTISKDEYYDNNAFLLITPSPADDFIKLSYLNDITSDYSVDITTLYGKSIGNWSLNQNTSYISIKSVPNGMYFCVVKNKNQQVAIKKFVVIHNQ